MIVSTKSDPIKATLHINTYFHSKSFHFYTRINKSNCRFTFCLLIECQYLQKNLLESCVDELGISIDLNDD